MSTLLSIARFELREELRRISTWVYFGIFFAMAFVFMAAMAGVWPDFDLGSRVLLANSPTVLANLTRAVAILAVPITSALAGRAVHRDFEARIHPLFFTTPISKGAYLGGRYLAAVAANLLVLLGIPLGLMAATVMPMVDGDRIGAFRLGGYVMPFLLVLVPNVLMTAAVFLVLAALTRRVLANQVGGLVLLLGWSLSRLFATAIDADWVTWLSDPFGGAPLSHATRYWTVAEQNALAMPVDLPLLVNRALWLAFGFAVLAYGIARFRFAQFAREDRATRAETAGAQAPSLAARLRMPVPRRAWGARARLVQLVAMTRDGTRRILRGAWFWILAGLCTVFVLISATEIGSQYGTRTFPVTYQVLELLAGVWTLFGIIIVTIYAGELVWEERENGSAQIHDSLPVPSWVPFAAKTLALTGMMAVLLAVGMLTGMLIQAARGYFRFEPWLYVRELFGFQLPVFVLVIVMAVTVQSLVNHKYVGHLIVILYWVVWSWVGFELVPHNLIAFPGTPSPFYSDMNGYGHSLVGARWFLLFWAGVAVLMAIVSNLFWVRGMETGGRWRVRLARARFSRPVLVATRGGRGAGAGDGRLHRLQHDGAERVGDGRGEQPHPARVRDACTSATTALPHAGDHRGHAGRGHLSPVARPAHPRRLPAGEPHGPAPRPDPRGPAQHAAHPPDGAGRAGAADHRGRGKGLPRVSPGPPAGAGGLHGAALRRGARSRAGFENEPSFLPVVQNGTFFDNHYLPGIGYNPQGELTDERRARAPRAAASVPASTPSTTRGPCSATSCRATRTGSTSGRRCPRPRTRWPSRRGGWSGSGGRAGGATSGTGWTRPC